MVLRDQRSPTDFGLLHVLFQSSPGECWLTGGGVATSEGLLLLDSLDLASAILGGTKMELHSDPQQTASQLGLNIRCMNEPSTKATLNYGFPMTLFEKEMVSVADLAQHLLRMCRKTILGCPGSQKTPE